MDSAVAVAAIVAGVPLLTVVLTGWLQWMGKKQDYARQDAVAEQAARAAALLLESNARVERQARDTASVVNGKLNQIHGLVNSTLSEALEGQLAILRELLVALESSTVPSVVALAAVRDRIAELESRLADRAQRTVIADSQVP